LSSFPARKVDVELPVYLKLFNLTIPLRSHGNLRAEKMAFEQTLLISVKNVDLQTGIKIIRSLIDPISVKSISIYNHTELGGDHT